MWAEDLACESELGRDKENISSILKTQTNELIHITRIGKMIEILTQPTEFQRQIAGHRMLHCLIILLTNMSHQYWTYDGQGK